MRCITLTQPYATLVAIGAKKIETRSWSTNYRGPLAIHAGKGPGNLGWMQIQHICRNEEPFKSALAHLFHDRHPASVLPFGAIIAVCELVDCVSSTLWQPVTRGTETWQVPPGNMSREYSFGDYSPGRYAWLLANVHALPEPIPARGQLGLWNWDGTL